MANATSIKTAVKTTVAETDRQTPLLPVDPLRQQRNRSVAGMVLSILFVNVIGYLCFDLRQTVPFLMGQIANAIILLSGIIGIGFFLRACWYYARLRGHPGVIGFLAALIGLGGWAGVALYLLQPTLEAQKQGAITTPDSHIPLALWGGFAVAGLLLKALPARNGAIEAVSGTPAAIPAKKKA